MGDTYERQKAAETKGFPLLHVTLTILFALFFISFVSVRNVQAAEATLTWDHNQESGIAGYRLHYGRDSGHYGTTIDVGNFTSCVIADLEVGATYFFAATAYNASGVESDYSNEVSHVITGRNEPPIADAGPDQTVNEGAAATLNGANSSDPDGGIIFFQWMQLDGPSVTLSSSTVAAPTFTTPDVGVEGESLAFQLMVEDSSGLSAADTCIINVTWENESPVADAGPDQTVSEGAIVALDGSGSSDPDDGISRYEWVQTDGPRVTLSSTAAAEPTFDAPYVGQDGTSLVFQLTVSDGEGLRSTDACIVNVITQNTPPQADAGLDQEVNEGTTFVLDASASFDADGVIISYRWEQIGGTPVTLSEPGACRTTCTAPEVRQKGDVLAFQLTVMDNGELRSTDTCTVTVDNVSTPPGLDKPKPVKKK